LTTEAPTQPDAQPHAPAGTPAPQAKPKPKSPRRRSRELALQGLYEWQLGHADAGVVDAHIREEQEAEYARADAAHFDALLHGCIREAEALDDLLRPFLDRNVVLLSPVEHAALWIGAYEMKTCIDVPYRVAINEAVELTKSFGGTDGHKFVNGVLDKAAAVLRPAEVQARRNAPRR
jgi:N utilization substance protein B